MLSDVLSPDRDNGTQLLGHRRAVFNTQDFFLFRIYHGQYSNKSTTGMKNFEIISL